MKKIYHDTERSEGEAKAKRRRSEGEGEVEENRNIFLFSLQGSMATITKVKCHYVGCKAKIVSTNLAIAICNCEKHFCPKHKFPSDHFCEFDYKAKFKASLDAGGMAVAGSIGYEPIGDCF